MKAIKTIIALILCIISIAVNAEESDISHGYALLGKLKYKNDFKNFEYVNQDAPKGGKIKFAYPSIFDSLNPFILKGNSAPGLAYTYETLMADSMDEPASQYGLIAEKIIIPKDRKWVEFVLRLEAKWHDGTRITASDVAFSFDTLKDRGNPNFRILFNEVQKAEAINDHQIRFYLKNSQDPTIIATIGSLPIISKAFFTTHDLESYHDKPFLGSGPYKVKEYNFGKYIIYERVDNYWGRDLPVNKGQYNFNQIQYDCYQDMEIAVQALLNGEYDFRQENVARIWATQYNGDAFKKGLMIKETMSSKQSANLQAMFFNLRKPVLTDVNLRKAINLAYDFDWVNKYLFYDSYKRLESYFHNTEFAATGLPEGRELNILSEFIGQVPNEVFTDIYVTPGTNATRQTNRENLKQAKQILLNSGYKVLNGKMISPVTQKPVELEIIYEYQAFERIFHALKDNLANIGITLNLRFIDKAQYELRVQKFDYDLINGVFVPSIIPGSVQEMVWHSKSDMTGGYNLAGVHNPVVDNLIQRIKHAKDKVELVALSKALDRVLLWNYYTVPQYYSPGFRIIYWDKFERPKIKPTYNIGESTWWMKKS